MSDLAEFPKFKYHSDPIGTETFKKADEPRVCQCCGKKTEALAKRTPGCIGLHTAVTTALSWDMWAWKNLKNGSGRQAGRHLQKRLGIFRT